MEKSVLRALIGRVKLPGDKFTDGTYRATQVLWPITRELYKEWMGPVFVAKDQNGAVLQSVWWYQNVEQLSGFHYPSKKAPERHDWEWATLAIVDMPRFRRWLSEDREDVYGEFCP